MQANKAEIVRARISPEIKHSAEQVLASLGMSMSDAIRIFVSQVAIRQSRYKPCNRCQNPTNTPPQAHYLTS